MLQIEIVQGEVDLELVKEREKALQQLEVYTWIVKGPVSDFLCKFLSFWHELKILE